MKLDRKPAKLGVLRRGCGGGGVEVEHKGIHAISLKVPRRKDKREK